MVLFSSCAENGQLPSIKELDAACAFSKYEALRDSAKLAYMISVHESDEPLGDVNALSNEIKGVSKKIVSDCLDSLYMEYSNKTVSEMVYAYKKVKLDSKDDVYKFFENSTSYEIMMEIARQVEIKAYTKELIN
jgi:hypothetical protein